jgi:hypothetical protein
MPAKPAYFHRIGDAIQALRRVGTEWVDRRGVEEALGVSKTVAWRIMRRCGAPNGPGNTLMCSREGLISALLQIEATGECEREIRRRERVSEYLERLAETARARRIRVAEDSRAHGLVDSRFRKLPAGVELTRRRLTVEYATTAEFLERIGAVIFALQNDFDAVCEFIENGGGPA